MLSRPINKALQNVRAHHFLLAFLAVPLLALPNLPATSGRIQAVISFGILAAGVIMSLQTRDYTGPSARASKLLFTCLLFPILATILARLIMHKPLYFLGLDPDYMGIFAWLGILVAGLFWAPYIKTLLSKQAGYIYLTILLVSLLIDHGAVFSGLPVTGVFVNNVSFVLVANLLVLTSIAQKKVQWIYLLIGCAAVLFSQNLVGFCYLIGLLLYGVLHTTSRRQRILIGSVTAVSCVLPLILTGYFWGLQQTSITQSTRELSTLYKQSVDNFKPYQILYNNGPATLSTDINNQNPLPSAIVRSKELIGNAFGKHNLFYDYFVFFGLLGLLSLVIAIGLTLKYWLQGRVPDDNLLLYSLLLVHGLLFPPTVYVAVLFCAVQFGLLLGAKPSHQQTRKLRFIPLSFAAGLVLAGLLITIRSSSDEPTLHTRPATSPGFTESFNQDLQRNIEQSLQNRLAFTNAPRGTAVLLDAKSGVIKAAVDVASPNPTLCPASQSCRNPKQHAALQSWEPGSVMKPLLVAAGLDSGKISLTDNFLDPTYQKIDDFAVYDALPHEPQTLTVQGVLNASRNTGAIHIYRQLGTDQVRRPLWHTYLTEHFGFSHPTGIEPSEDSGYVRSPDGGRSLDRQYTMSAYGIGVTVTPLQLAAAYATLANGGMYITPHMSDQTPVQKYRAISSDTSKQMERSLQEVFDKNTKTTKDPRLTFGGKTGTAPAYDTNWSYKPATDIGVFAGFVKTNSETLVLVVKIDEPKTKEFASYAARDTWLEIIQKLYK